MNEIFTVSDYLVKNAETIGEELTKRVVAEAQSIDENLNIEPYIATKQRNQELISILGAALNKPKNIAEEELADWINEVRSDEIANFSSFSAHIATTVKSRTIFLEYLNEICLSLNITSESIVSINSQISYLFDVWMVNKMHVYEDHREQMIIEHQRAINDLSAPIVPIQHGVAVLPLVGSIDYIRVQHLLTYVLPTIPDMDIDFLIIDFSGILTIDEEIAQHIFTIHNVLELLGIHVLFTGIRPNLSMVIVQAGIDFSSFQTYGSVKQAIESINNK
ncbi:STAS domain-containing protein [Psychrobacillus sp. FSL W7-1493]|uniref:STAS domain-containing protein n=1 Tax=Psychrobacillus sp. FSL W7-1493 TaxID=2921552 RepID=UPI0030F907DE